LFIIACILYLDVSGEARVPLHSNKKQNPPPGSLSFPATAHIFVQGMQTTLPYVIGVFMVRDFLSAASSSATGGTPSPPPSEAQVGKLTGLLGASFCAAQLVTSYPLGRLSDRIGRRPLILLGNLSCIVSVLAFGFSATYAQATLSRIVGGLTNAVIGAEKAILGESLGPEEQSLAMAHLSMMWGVGVLLGPALGGLLARPCGVGAVLGDSGDIAGIIDDTTTTSPLRSPSSGGLLCSSQGLLRQRPFLLPCVAAAALNAIALVLTALFLEESLPSKRRGGTSGSAALYTAVSSADVEDIRAATHASVGSGNAEIEMSRPIAANDSLGGSEPYSRPVSRQDRGAVPAAAGSRSSLGVRNDEQCRRLRTADSVAELADVEGFKPKQTVPWHRQPNVVLCLSGYAPFLKKVVSVSGSCSYACYSCLGMPKVYRIDTSRYVFSLIIHAGMH
jgi:MFS family permease